eukprot:scaffold31_cov334-Pavlova_lutheri.AAC.26
MLDVSSVDFGIDTRKSLSWRLSSSAVSFDQKNRRKHLRTRTGGCRKPRQKKQDRSWINIGDRHVS